MGHKEFNKEVREQCAEITKANCLARNPEPTHEVSLCDFTNWIIAVFESYNGKKHVSDLLLKKGFEVCLKRDATLYAVVTKKGEDCSSFHLWLRPYSNR